MDIFDEKKQFAAEIQQNDESLPELSNIHLTPYCQYIVQKWFKLKESDAISYKYIAKIQTNDHFRPFFD